MHWIDSLLVVLYLLATLALGLWLARRVKDTDDLFLAGRRLPFWAVGMSLVVSDIGAMEMVGATASAHSYGITQANFEWIGCVPAMVVGGLLFIPLYWKLGVRSIPEFLGATYGPLVRAVLALVWVIFLGAALGIFFHASATMFEQVLGWQRWPAIAITAAVVSIYTVGGGLGAVVVTDVVQCAVLFAGGLALAFLGLAEVGGVTGLREGLAAAGERARHHLELLQPVDLVDESGVGTGYPWSGVLLGLGLVLSPAYWLGHQAIVQRTLGAKDAWHARASMLLGAGLKTFIPVAFVLPGLLAVVLLGPDLETGSNAVFPTLVERLAPVGLRGLLYAAFLAALMSSVDSYANSAATILTSDVYQRLAPGREERHYLLVGRLASLGVIAAGVAMVPVVDRFPTIYDAFQTYLSVFQGPTLALLLGAALFRGAVRPAGGVACLAAGIGSSIAMHRAGDLHWLHVAWWSFVVSILALAAGSRWAADRKGGGR